MSFPQVYYMMAVIIEIGMNALRCASASALLNLSLKRIRKDYREKDYAIHRTELLFILAPALVILLLLLFFIMSGVKLFQDMICWNREKNSWIILEKQVSSLQEHMREKELHAYLEELNRSIDGLEFRFKTGNFVELAAAKVTDKSEISGMSFKDMWQARFPGAYYHTADASSIPQGVWERNDFPFEKIFCNDLDEAAVIWKPNGANPAMDSSGVQSRLHSIAGQKSIVVPPELEEK